AGGQRVRQPRHHRRRGGSPAVRRLRHVRCRFEGGRTGLPPPVPRPADDHGEHRAAGFRGGRVTDRMGAMTVCPSCHRVVTEEDAAFCAGCGARLTVAAPPVPVPVVDPVPSVAPPVTAPPVDAAHEVVQPAAVTPSTASRRRTNANRQAAFVALVGAALAIVGAFQVWVRIRIAGLAPPGSAQSGWAGGDGRTIVVAAGVAAVAALASLLGRRETWVKIVLLITGATTTIIAIVNMVDAGSKAH